MDANTLLGGINLAKPSIIQVIKDRIKNSGSGKQGIFYLRADTKKRIRFLADLDDAVKVVFHDKWGEVNTPCLKHYGKSCKYCKRDDIRTRDNFAWPVYSYDDKKV